MTEWVDCQSLPQHNNNMCHQSQKQKGRLSAPAPGELDLCCTVVVCGGHGNYLVRFRIII